NIQLSPTMQIKEEEYTTDNEDDEVPPMLERQEPIYASDTSFGPSLAESVKTRKRAATTTLANQKDDNLTTRYLHDDVVMDRMIGKGEDAVSKRSVKKVKRGGTKGMDRGRSMNSRSRSGPEEDLSNDERDNVKRRDVTKEAESDIEQMEDEDKQHTPRGASISAKLGIKDRAKKTTKNAKKTTKKEGMGPYPSDPITIPEHMKYVSLRYNCDKRYFEERTTKVAWDCGLWLKDLVVGRQLTMLYGNKRYAANIVGFAPTEEECRKLTDAHNIEEQLALWNRLEEMVDRRAKREEEAVRKREEEKNKVTKEFWEGCEMREKRERKQEQNGMDKDEEEMDAMSETPARRTRSRTRKTTIHLTMRRRRLKERKSESNQGYEDDERNEVKVQKRTKRRGNDHHLHNKNSRAAQADTNSVEVEAEANDDMGEQVHEMDTGDEPTVVFDLNAARIEEEKRREEYEKWKEEKERRRNDKAKKEEEKREQRRKRIMQKQQQELDRYRSRENEERRRIVKDGMGGDEAMLPPTTIRIPKRSSQDRKSGDGALADDTNVCRVKTEPAEETMETDEPPAPEATVVMKNSLFDKEESIDSKKRAIVQKKEEDCIVTKRDDEDTVAEEISTVGKTSANSDGGLKNSTDSLASRPIAPKKEITYAQAMWLKGEDVVVLSSDDDEEGNKTKEEEGRLKDDRIDKEAEDIRNTLDTMKTQATPTMKHGRGDLRLTSMSYVKYAGAAAKTLAARYNNSLPSYGSNQSSVSGVRPPYMLQPFGASTHGLVPTSSSFAHVMAPNPISTRTPVHISFNPHPWATTAFNNYYQSQRMGMNPLASSSSMQSAQNAVSSSSLADAPLMQLQQNVMPCHNQQSSSKSDEKFTMQDVDEVDAWLSTMMK
ncbi:hypothetical protein PRIPAC_80760, partial [Pristionchus pacificus]|uniref:Uncharacterized protein n=1 Tax=Pristionchus pacificus TaxID=54126 RepID=A0A2A6CL99_PRIPA